MKKLLSIFCLYFGMMPCLFAGYAGELVTAGSIIDLDCEYFAYNRYMQYSTCQLFGDVKDKDHFLHIKALESQTGHTYEVDKNRCVKDTIVCVLGDVKWKGSTISPASCWKAYYGDDRWVQGALPDCTGAPWTPKGDPKKQPWLVDSEGRLIRTDDNCSYNCWVVDNQGRIVRKNPEEDCEVQTHYRVRSTVGLGSEGITPVCVAYVCDTDGHLHYGCPNGSCNYEDCCPPPDAVAITGLTEFSCPGGTSAAHKSVAEEARKKLEASAGTKK